MLGNTPSFESKTTKSAVSPCHVSACGKAILVGEHAVVYGSHAVALPLRDMRLDLSVSPSNEMQLPPRVSMKANDLQMTQRVADVFVEAAELLGAKEVPSEVVGQSRLPIGAGVGSSAALCVSALRGVAGIMGMTLKKSQLASLANTLEKRFHGQPSGLDTAVVAHESCLLFKRQATMRVLDTPHPQYWNFVLLDSGVRASTMSMIRLASPYFRGVDGDRRIVCFDELAMATAEALKAGDVVLMSELISECDRLLSELGIVTHDLSSMISELKRLGCLAAKTTGAGGGGVVLALLDPSNTVEILARLKESFGSDRVFPVSV